LSADEASAPPAPITQISAPELQAMLASGTPVEIIDVRTAEERAIAAIEGARLFSEATHQHILTLDRGATVVFQCHHGMRSQAAAEYYAREHGFRRLFNLEGGIDAWSCLVDPAVPRY
jgi:monothiol glutaredoxin